MGDETKSEDEQEQNSFSQLMGTVDEMIDDLKEEEELVIPEDHVGVNRLIRALDSFQEEIRKNLQDSGKVPNMNEVAQKVNLAELEKRISEIRVNSGNSDEFDAIENEFGKTKALEIMKFVQEICHSISLSIDKRKLEVENGKISNEVYDRIEQLDESAREGINNVTSMLAKIKDFFPLSSVDSEWREKVKGKKEEYAKETSFSEGFANPSFSEAGYDLWDLTYANSLSDLPSVKTFLETSFFIALEHIYGHLQAMFLFKSKSMDLESLLSPIPEIGNLTQFAEMLVSKANLLTTVPFEISEHESDEINDLLSKLISTQTSYLQMLEKLELGLGRYEPTLSDPNSHMTVYKHSPRTAYDALPMWPIKRKERYESLHHLDIFNWLGFEYHSENLTYDEQHRIVYRDFLNFIQHIGFEHKKVTAYDDENVRIQPKLSSFTWSGKKNKYRPKASIYFHGQHCPYTNREMRISIDSIKTPWEESITVNVGIDFFQKDVEELEIPPDEQALHKRELAEQYYTNLFKDFTEYQKEHGLLKNSKFNAFFEELELKGRTFDDLILSTEKKRLIDDNIFAILGNSKALMERGVETNRGIMLAGPPGVGKSLTIDAIIAEGNCTVLFADFIMLHKKMDMIFSIARKYAPTILIMEDIDALGITGQRGQRGDGAGLSTLLNHMDGIKSNNGVITVATSNHAELLDWALIARPGRFDVRIDYSYPNHTILNGIFRMKMKPYPHEKNIDLEKIVAQMPTGFTGSHIQDIVNQANYISLNEAKGASVGIKINQRVLEIAFERALYNFNKFLIERPHVKFEQGIEASEVLRNDPNRDDSIGFFG